MSRGRRPVSFSVHEPGERWARIRDGGETGGGTLVFTSQPSLSPPPCQHTFCGNRSDYKLPCVPARRLALVRLCPRGTRCT